MEDFVIRALCKKELGLIEELESKEKSIWYVGLKVLDLLPWKAYGIPDKVVGLFTYNESTRSWEGHMYANEEFRGKKAKQVFKEILKIFFEDTGQNIVLGITPREFKMALVMARSLGFKLFTETPELVISILDKEDL